MYVSSVIQRTINLFLGKNAKLPGYMDYLHLSTSDVGNLKESWQVLEDNVAKVFIYDVIEKKFTVYSLMTYIKLVFNVKLNMIFNMEHVQ